VTNFDKHEYASGPRDFLELVKEGAKLPRNADVPSISFKGRAVLVTGAGSGYVSCHKFPFCLTDPD
jgi:multifunctional beta-oxidation protein